MSLRLEIVGNRVTVNNCVSVVAFKIEKAFSDPAEVFFFLLGNNNARSNACVNEKILTFDHVVNGLS